jgi:hypothetical protein
MAVKHILVLDHFGEENYQIAVYLHMLYTTFVQTYFNQPEQFQGYPKLYENIVQYFLPN